MCDNCQSAVSLITHRRLRIARLHEVIPTVSDLTVRALSCEPEQSHLYQILGRLRLAESIHNDTLDALEDLLGLPRLEASDPSDVLASVS